MEILKLKRELITIVNSRGLFLLPINKRIQLIKELLSNPNKTIHKQTFDLIFLLNKSNGIHKDILVIIEQYIHDYFFSNAPSSASDPLSFTPSENQFNQQLISLVFDCYLNFAQHFPNNISLNLLCSLISLPHTPSYVINYILSLFSSITSSCASHFYSSFDSLLLLFQSILHTLQNPALYSLTVVLLKFIRFLFPSILFPSLLLLSPFSISLFFYYFTLLLLFYSSFTISLSFYYFTLLFLFPLLLLFHSPFFIL